jgi:isopenicillin N synthase-like dioxygenase
MVAGTGLQVLPASSTLSSNNWVSVPFIPDAILVNVGDLLEFWSAARFRSTLHRVRNGAPMEGEEEDSKKRAAVDERYSMAFFCHPRPDTAVKALVERSSQVSDIDVERMERKGVKLGVELTAHQHLMARLGATGQ